MIKKIKTVKEIITKRKFCDVCGTECTTSLHCHSVYCVYCKKDLCNNCIGHEEDSGSNWRMYWCKQCWKLGEKYRPLIDEMEAKITQLYSKWQNECKKK